MAAGGWLVVEDPPLRRPVVTAALEEVWKGEAPPATTVRFAQHGHGVAPYAEGEEVLLFLRRIERSRELKLRLATAPARARTQATILLTVHTMNALHARRHEIPL